MLKYHPAFGIGAGDLVAIEDHLTFSRREKPRDDIQKRVEPIRKKLAEHGSGYNVEYGGQFESERAATELIALLSLVALGGVFLVLYTLFRSVNLSLQVMAALPMAAIGAMLLVAGFDLAVSRHLRRVSRDQLLVIALTGISCVLTNVAAGLLVGVVLEWLRARLVVDDVRV